jgi:branched-chain amino acid transport system substrate-binding protein
MFSRRTPRLTRFRGLNRGITPSTKSGLSVAILSTVALVALAGCGGGSSSSAGTATGTGSSSSSSANIAEATKWVADYTKGTPGQAKSSNSPVTIGYINQQGGVEAFPGATYGYQTIANFLNANVSGIKGHPLKLSTCYVETEEDGQKCAAQFENEHVPLILTGQLVVGTASLHEAIGGTIPIVNMNPGSPPDLASPNSYGIASGALSLSGVGGFIANRLKPKKVAVIYEHNPTGDLIAQELLKPTLEAAGIEPTLVSFASTATVPALTAALSSSGAQSAELLVSIIAAEPCMSFAQAYKELGLTVNVVTEGECTSAHNTEALGGAWPDGWYFANNQAYATRVPDQASGVNAFLEIMDAEPSAAEWKYDTKAEESFPAIMLAAKLLDQVGPEATAAEMTSALKAYNGPIALNSENFECGLSKTAPDICGYRVSFIQSEGGKFLPAAIGSKAISVLTGE